MRNANRFQSLGLGTIYDKVMQKERLSFEDGLKLFACPDLMAVGALALHKRTELHGSRTHYVVNRQINYTNICVNRCTFCAFRRDNKDAPGAFTLSKDEILARVQKAQNTEPPLDELHIVGGCHPSLRLAWFEDLLSSIHKVAPDLPIKAFTPVEINHFARIEGISTKEVLARLKAAGLIMMPGGGAEIFDERLRSAICPQKANTSEWLAISKEAHELGITSNCTMLFGHLETCAMRVDHLIRLRTLQDKTKGFVCFIPLPFLQKNSRLTLPNSRKGPVNGLDHLRTIAVSRLLLDNIPHIKAYWIMLGVKMAQTALWFGADDLDGTIVEEHIGHMAGSKASQALTIDELETMIRQSGMTPVRRNATFTALGQKTDTQTPFAVAHSAFSEGASVQEAIACVRDGGRLTRPLAEALYFEASLETLGELAHAVRCTKHPEAIVTYVGDRNINYSNICECGCRFCAFFRII